MNTMPLPKSLRRIVDAIHSSQDMHQRMIRQIVQDASVQPEDLEPWTDFNHSAADSYGRILTYDGGFFEVMVMSWCPGDVSAIHDHGYTQWGAVQVFGPAEHAVFLVQDEQIRTLSRSFLRPGQILSVGHQLIHQMGNLCENTNFLSLHIYGNYERTGEITADARVFDLDEGKIQRTDGGVFQALPEQDIKRREPGPEPDFCTWLRNTVDISRRVLRAMDAGVYQSSKDFERLEASLFDVNRKEMLLENLDELSDEEGRVENLTGWKLLCNELGEAANLQHELLEREGNGEDFFARYAKLYDDVIGKPCLDEFIAKDLHFFFSNYNIDLTRQTILSVGCGTGIVERYMIDELGVPYEHLFGIDISKGMIQVAAERIHAEVGDLLELDPDLGLWDVVFHGLNVFQYLDHHYFDECVRKVAGIIKPGGYFVGDFITPDHIRWYPNVMYSQDNNVVSLRTPQLVEKENCVYQRARIINVEFDDKMRIADEGSYERFLPPIGRVRHYFEKTFSGPVDVYDAVSLEPILPNADTCPSTRYLVCARN